MEAPSDHVLFPAMANCFVHVVMYAYYAFSIFPNLQPYLWWKKYLTQLQLAQFVIVMLVVSVGIIQRCDFPIWMSLFNLGFLTSLVFLFSHFYIQAYMKRHRSHQYQQEKKAVLKEQSAVDGHSPSISGEKQQSTKLKKGLTNRNAESLNRPDLARPEVVSREKFQ